MKSFNEFKLIAYKSSLPHNVFSQGKQKKIPKGKAVPVRSRSSAGDSGDGSGCIVTGKQIGRAHV